MKKLSAAIAFCAGFLAVLPARAGEVADLAAKAEALMAEGKHLEAIQAMDDASLMLWDQSPLVVSKALFVASRPTGFGAYEVRENNVFKIDEPLLVYAEPLGFGHRLDGRIYEIHITVDFEVITADGRSLGGQDGFGTFKVRSRVRNREFNAFLSYAFKGLPAGDYVIKTTLHDQVSGKNGEFSLPFSVVE